jgi:hypothetical protein
MGGPFLALAVAVDSNSNYEKPKHPYQLSAIPKVLTKANLKPQLGF